MILSHRRFSEAVCGQDQRMPTLLWFRRDLRLHDLPALLDAANADGEVLACYVLDPRSARVVGGPAVAVPVRLAARTSGRPRRSTARHPRAAGDPNPAAGQGDPCGVGARVGDFSPFGVRRDKAVRDALGDVPLEESGSPYLVSPAESRRVTARPTRCSRPFYAAWRDHGWRAPAQSGPKSATWIDPADVDGGVDIPDGEVKLELPAGESAARKAWKTFVDSKLSDYEEDREPARPRRNQPDVGSPEVRHHPPPHHGRRPRRREGCPGLPARARVPRLLRRRALRVAAQRVVELEQGLRPHRGRRRRRGDGSGSRRGRRDGPASPSSTPACANSPRPASCTTGCG